MIVIVIITQCINYDKILGQNFILETQCVSHFSINQIESKRYILLLSIIVFF